MNDNKKWYKTSCNVCGYSYLKAKKVKCTQGHKIKVIRNMLGFEFYSTDCYQIRHRIEKDREREKELIKT